VQKHQAAENAAAELRLRAFASLHLSLVTPAAVWGVHPIDEAPDRFAPFYQPVEWKLKQPNKDAMKTKKQSYEPSYVAKNGVTIKTVSLQVAVTEPDLKKAVREAFNLAKSGGRELNLAFSLQSLT
jgi:hypothetical protein